MLLTGFLFWQTVLNLKRDEVGTLRNRLQIGLDKLMTTAHEVAKLQEELTAMEPKLVATQKEVEEMIVTLEADKKTAAETKVCPLPFFRADPGGGFELGSCYYSTCGGR